MARETEVGGYTVKEREGVYTYIKVDGKNVYFDPYASFDEIVYILNAIYDAGVQDGISRQGEE